MGVRSKIAILLSNPGQRMVCLVIVSLQFCKVAHEKALLMSLLEGINLFLRKDDHFCFSV